MPLDAELVKQLLQTFQIELDERIQAITNGLLLIEKGNLTPADLEAAIQSIFRAAHNIKGAARSLGIDQIGDIAHHLETLFSVIQKEKVTVTREQIDLCFEAIDKMQSTIQSHIEEKPLNFDMNDLLKRLSQRNISAVHDKPLSAPTEVDMEAQPKTQPKAQPKKQPPLATQQHETSLKEKDLISANDTIRISIANIDKITALMEEMQVNKIIIDDHYTKLAKVMNKTTEFGDIWKQITNYLKNKMLNISSNDNLQKLYYSGSDYFNEINSDLDQLHKNMRSQINNLSNISSSLQDEIRTMRLIPAATLFRTLHRYARDLAHALNKQVELKITGDDIKIDRMVLERLKDPLNHLLRNSIDHGIENTDIRKALGKPEIGLIQIDLNEKDNQVFITITDDGAGIDVKKVAEIALKKNLISQAELEAMSENDVLALILRPGFSTKEIITDTSGRGVGLDIVKTNIENLKGNLEIATQFGKYTTFTLRVPISLSSERGLMVTSGGQMFVIPTSAVQCVLAAHADEIYDAAGRQAIVVNEQPVSFCSLADMFGLVQKQLSQYERLPIIVLSKGWKSVAIMVDRIIGEREIVVKALQSPLTNIPCVSGGTLYGNNQVIAVLEPTELIEKSLHSKKAHQFIRQLSAEKTVIKPSILVVDDSITTRTLEKSILESKNYQVTIAVNGQDAWDILQKQQFSLVITDISMPIMDGFTLTEMIKANDKFRDLPVIIVTSLDSDEEKKKGIAVGADAYIIKHEFESGALLDIVEQLV